MLIRFASGSLVACIVTAIASLATLIFFGLNPQRFALILAIWCAVPCLWGLWAMLSPSDWVPRRLPIWGMILGIVAGVMATFVLNLPSRILGVILPNPTRALVVLLAGVFYYVLWIVVSIVYKHLFGSNNRLSRA
ncbi:MAG TPA: hypothetical protein VMP68_29870 [Candidatus Eisenbacteria bacterium]|nr:hypothetical protein [Candidatus Eisenbacteria bacterium]